MIFQILFLVYTIGVLGSVVSYLYHEAPPRDLDAGEITFLFLLALLWPTDYIIRFIAYIERKLDK